MNRQLQLIQLKYVVYGKWCDKGNKVREEIRRVYPSKKEAERYATHCRLKKYAGVEVKNESVYA